MSVNNDAKLQNTLKHLQRRAQVSFDRKLTHKELAEMAGVKKRSLDEWMRGATSPLGMGAILELLSRLPTDDAIAVLDYWKSDKSTKT